MTQETRVTKRQVAQMIRQAFERRKNGQARPVGILDKPPFLEELEDGQEMEVDLRPAQVGPGDPLRPERRRYVRRGDRLFFQVMEEVK